MASFLQSLEWARIEKRDGHKAARLVFGRESLAYFTHPLPFGFYYFYVPRPVIQDARAFGEAINKLGKSAGALFFRLELENEISTPNLKFPTRPAPHLQPQETIKVDLSKSDEALLAEMHPKTRYNIRIAEKRGVTVEEQVGQNRADKFYALLEKTSKRDGFYLHPKPHYEHLLLSNSCELDKSEFENVIFAARRGGEVAAMAMVNFYGGTATYLHGASDYALRRFMAPHLLHWRIMQTARERGCVLYDLWGIDEARWPGVTRFKKGFGGETKTYPAARDIVFRPFWYKFYTLARRIRRH